MLSDGRSRDHGLLYGMCAVSVLLRTQHQKHRKQIICLLEWNIINSRWPTATNAEWRIMNGQNSFLLLILWRCAFVCLLLCVCVFVFRETGFPLSELFARHYALQMNIKCCSGLYQNESSKPFGFEEMLYGTVPLATMMIMLMMMTMITRT